jgi:peptidoglycan/xylan/chitin deacetylase (PgdA/CDA1 family)
MNRLSLAAARAAAAFLSPAGRRARLSILIFHRVRESADPLFPDEITAESFDRQLALLGSVFNLLPLPEAIERMSEGRLPPRTAAITFDDGYRDNAEIAAPILQRRGVHATFFVATGFLDGGRMWNDTLIETMRRTRVAALDLGALGLGRIALGDLAARRLALSALIRAIKHRSPEERARAVAAVAAAGEAELPADLMMSSAQVKALADAGMEIGGHTVSHPILARLSLDEARREINDGRASLAQITGRPVRLFAYPNGKPGTDYLPEHAELACRLGFAAALSTTPGVSTAASDFFQLPRFTPWDRDENRFAWRAVANLRRVV